MTKTQTNIQTLGRTSPHIDWFNENTINTKNIYHNIKVQKNGSKNENIPVLNIFIFNLSGETHCTIHWIQFCTLHPLGSPAVFFFKSYNLEVPSGYPSSILYPGRWLKSNDCCSMMWYLEFRRWMVGRCTCIYLSLNKPLNLAI